MIGKRIKALLLTWLCIFSGILIVPSAMAHEVRPAYLSLEEEAINQFSVVWKRPVKESVVPAISPHFPPQCQLDFSPLFALSAGAKIQQGVLHCGELGLSEGEIRIDGLETTLMDVLVRIQWKDETVRQQLLKRSDSFLVLSDVVSPPVADYMLLGFEHILEGYDHLLFVLALLLIVPGKIALFKTITAFTLAHSITLALAALGLLNVPAAPVEASIALSIAWIAAEAIYQRRGMQSLSTKSPWLVALMFGLLHGLGFAGALSEVGLPKGDVISALLLFNLGIELGQLLVVVVVLMALQVLRRLPSLDLRSWRYVSAYGIGGLGMFWALERVVNSI